MLSFLLGMFIGFFIGIGVTMKTFHHKGMWLDPANRNPVEEEL